MCLSELILLVASYDACMAAVTGAAFSCLKHLIYLICGVGCVYSHYGLPVPKLPETGISMCIQILWGMQGQMNAARTIT